MRDFKDLVVWQKAHRFALDVYQATTCFPHEEKYGLTAQLRRSATSIPTNIAEGCGRNGDRELARFLSIAAGSASEAEYLLLLSLELGYLSQAVYSSLFDSVCEIKKMLRALQRKLSANG
jgi:four helix bundle protein